MHTKPSKVSELNMNAELLTETAEKSEFPFPCKHCYMKFPKIGNLRMHLKRTHGISNLHTCDQCDYTTMSNSDMINHRNRMHLNKRPYSCDQCDSSFFTTTELSRHTNAVHLKILYPCEYCDYKSPNKRNITLHINRKHLKLRPFLCILCNKAFCAKGDLNRHKQLVHGKEMQNLVF